MLREIELRTGWTPYPTVPTMCEYNTDCTRPPGVVVTIGPGESVLDCCGVVVGSSFAESEKETASP
ncbi:hypothetical protein SAMN04487948_102469 [Halogranum amylolyticum]|uniref:Uncharacterized protein n=1 Tax=Halogranum amylolyticum TaxID=660520 RepID=A0A1H8PT39_9EURY|nr:hypothetical protein SAMN04487948_102469 [Halogranum amylolyticum]